MREATTGHRVRGTEGKADVTRKQQLSIFYFLHKGEESPTGKITKHTKRLERKSSLWC